MTATASSRRSDGGCSMGVERFTRAGGLMRVASATVAALVTVALAGSGTASAAPHRDGVTAQHAGTTAAGTISTVAGGVGGPGLATRITVGPDGLAFAGGQLYIATGSTVRKV